MGQDWHDHPVGRVGLWVQKRYCKAPGVKDRIICIHAANHEANVGIWARDGHVKDDVLCRSGTHGSGVVQTLRSGLALLSGSRHAL